MLSLRLCCVGLAGMVALGCIPPVISSADAQYRYRAPRVYNGTRFYNTRTATMQRALAKKRIVERRAALARREAAKRRARY